jgi:octaprenyl-diphosphate synthase
MLAAESKGATLTESPNADPNHSWNQIMERVNPFLQAVDLRLIQQANDFDPKIVPYAKAALNGGGKHLRPTLVALAGGAIGKVGDAHITAAVIIEMVHLATLVHDDVMDEAEIRRGQLTIAANWGNEIAVLFGDCLFAQAVKMAAGFPTPEICRAVATATNTVCTGEILQTQYRRNFELSRRDYFRVIEMKTAELFTLSCDLAAFLCDAKAESRAALRQFGAAFGTAYQVYDDCVDLFGSETAAGKSLGTDLAKGKLTWPVLLAWERADAGDRARLENLIEHWQPENLAAVNALMERYETLLPSLEVIAKYLKLARQALKILPDSGGRAGLFGLADFLAQQTGVLTVSS